MVIFVLSVIINCVQLVKIMLLNVLKLVIVTVKLVILIKHAKLVIKENI